MLNSSTNRNAIKILALLIVFSVIYLQGYGQGAFEKELHVYIQSVRKWALKQSETDTTLRKVIKLNPEIIVRPFCEFRCNSSKILETSSGFDLLHIDTVVNYTLFADNKKVYIIAWPRREGVLKYKIEKNEPNGVDVMEYCRQYSSEFFKLSVLIEDEGRYIFGFIENKHAKLVDRDLILYDGLNDYLSKTYGCLEKYVERSEIDVERLALLAKMKTIDDCKKVLRNSYVSWARNGELDTGFIANVFFKEADSVAGLSTTQSALLKSKIKYWIAEGMINFKEDYLLEFLGSVFTNEQYIKYRKHLNIMNWVVSIALGRIEQYYIVDKKLPVEKEDEILRKEVFYK